MSLLITTLNNEAAVARTFSEVSKDRSVAEWINTSDSVSGHDVRLLVKQQTAGKTPEGIPVRRSLVQTLWSAPLASGIGVERVTFNATLISPTSLSVLTDTHRNDLVAFVRNFLFAANVEKIANGEL